MGILLGDIKNKENSHVFSAYLAVVLGLLVCLLPVISLFDYDRKRFAEVLLVLFMLIGFAANRSVQQVVICFFYKLTIFYKLILFAFGGLSICSIYMAYEISPAIVEAITLISLVLIAFISSHAWRAYPFLVCCLILGIGACLLILEVQFLTYYVAHLVINNPFVAGGFFPSFENVRFFNQFQIWLLPFFTFVSLLDNHWSKDVRLRGVIWGSGVIWWIMFFTTDGRGAVVAALVSATVLMFLYREHASVFLIRTLLMSASGYVCYLLLFSIIPLLVYGQSKLGEIGVIRSGSSYRLDYLWPIAIEFIRTNPFFGVGPMHYAWFTNEIAAHPHNSILQLGSEWGLPVLFILIFFIFKGLKNWVIRFNRKTLEYESHNFQLITSSLTFSIVGASVYSLFCGVIVMPMSHLTGALICSFMLAFYGPSYVSEAVISKRNIFITLIVLCISVAYFYLIFADALPRLLEPGYLPEIDLNVNGPRFWMIGDISK